MRTARRFWYRRAVYVRMGVNEKNPSPGQTKQPNEHLKIRESGKSDNGTALPESPAIQKRNLPETNISHRFWQMRFQNAAATPCLMDDLGCSANSFRRFQDRRRSERPDCAATEAGGVFWGECVGCADAAGQASFQKRLLSEKRCLGMAFMQTGPSISQPDTGGA